MNQTKYAKITNSNFSNLLAEHPQKLYLAAMAKNFWLKAGKHNLNFCIQLVWINQQEVNGVSKRHIRDLQNAQV